MSRGPRPGCAPARPCDQVGALGPVTTISVDRARADLLVEPGEEARGEQPHLGRPRGRVRAHGEHALVERHGLQCSRDVGADDLRPAPDDRRRRRRRPATRGRTRTCRAARRASSGSRASGALPLGVPAGWSDDRRLAHRPQPRTKTLVAAAFRRSGESQGRGLGGCLVLVPLGRRVGLSSSGDTGDLAEAHRVRGAAFAEHLRHVGAAPPR